METASAGTRRLLSGHDLDTLRTLELVKPAQQRPFCQRRVASVCRDATLGQRGSGTRDREGASIDEVDEQ
jgi:hypothetical protein